MTGQIQISGTIERFQHLSTPVVYDIMDQMGYPQQALSHEIRPLSPDMTLAGPAFTLEGRDFQAGVPGAIPADEMYRAIVPDAVIVMATNGHRISAPWGENTSMSARVRGARGIVIDGGTRDADAVAAMGFPLFCRYVTPVFSLGRYQTTGYQRPVRVAGQVGEFVTVQPGDFVLADRDGVVIVPQALIEEVLVAAERLEQIEEHIRGALRAGEDREAVYKRFPKFAHVRKAKDGPA